MAVNILGTSDDATKAIAGALQSYADTHPAAEVDVYRYSPVSVRARVIDPDFRGKSRSERHRTVWPLLYQLDEDNLSELTMLLLLPPDEKEVSDVNRDFETGQYAKAYSLALQSSQIKNGAAP